MQDSRRPGNRIPAGIISEVVRRLDAFKNRVIELADKTLEVRVHLLEREWCRKCRWSNYGRECLAQQVKVQRMEER